MDPTETKTAPGDELDDEQWDSVYGGTDPSGDEGSDFPGKYSMG